MKLITKVDVRGHKAGDVVEVGELEGKRLLSLGFAVPVHGYDEDAQGDIGATAQEIKDARSEHGPEDDILNDFPRHTGGGWYELSNGETVRGHDDAVEAENNLERTDS